MSRTLTGTAGPLTRTSPPRKIRTCTGSTRTREDKLYHTTGKEIPAGTASSSQCGAHVFGGKVLAVLYGTRYHINTNTVDVLGISVG